MLESVAWVLLVHQWRGLAYAIPGIASQEECRRLGSALAGDAEGWAGPKWTCVAYRMAR